jgi:hypothetical protein
MGTQGGEVRRVKFYRNGEKKYAAILRLGRRERVLRRSSRTATAALEYGWKVRERYERLCDLAVTKAMMEVQS